MTTSPQPLEIPQSFEAEQALIGSILLNNAVFSHVAEIVEVHHFSDPLHGKIYDTIAKLIERGQVVSLFTLKTYFDADVDMKAAGGAAYWARLAAASVHMVDAKSFGKAIRDTAIRRKLIAVATAAMQAAYTPEGGTATDVIEQLERALFEISITGGAEQGFEPFTAGLTRAISQAEKAHHRSGRLSGIATGFEALDKLLGGLHRSDLIIIAARPSMGKTALVTNIAVNAARNHKMETGEDGKRHTIDGAIVGFFSLEMSTEQLTTRVLGTQANVPSNMIRRGKLNSFEFDAVLTASSALESLPLHIDDTAALTIAALRSRARRLKRQHGLDLLIVDYLQLVDATNRKDGRVQEVSEITRGLKTLAKELDVPVVALSQLSRAVENRTDKRPQLADLRDSGTIEQDADVVMFVYREEYYLERGGDADQAKLDAVRGKAEIHIAKQRHGPTGSANLMFNGKLTKFSDVEEPDGTGDLV